MWALVLAATHKSRYLYPVALNRGAYPPKCLIQPQRPPIEVQLMLQQPSFLKSQDASGSERVNRTGGRVIGVEEKHRL
ncbi:hypothetical protein XELAEV_18021782mg [Xenopus laevis]|uniref:Uncharacterized protein n=1 Tax=Xenopus laevis TaxID=8355 RepID=A0A974D161_XENLA|nr:hypothetical protein XELAEV_18021782mg [Xenopus laevis]